MEESFSKYTRFYFEYKYLHSILNIMVDDFLFCCDSFAPVNQLKLIKNYFSPTCFKRDLRSLFAMNRKYGLFRHWRKSTIESKDMKHEIVEI